MEDEEGELFDNTYLDELQSGDRISPSGRDSLSLDEIQRRNSMVPPHLRSSYTAQFSDSTPNASDDVFLKVKIKLISVIITSNIIQSIFVLQKNTLA